MTDIKKMSHILVAGGDVFIGAYLVKRLIEMNIKETIVDKLLNIGDI